MLENPQTDKDSRVLVGQQLYHCHLITQQFLMISAISLNRSLIFLASAGMHISFLSFSIVISSKTVLFYHFPMQKWAKISPRMSSVVTSPVISPSQ